MKKFTLNALLTLVFLLAASMIGMAQILPDNWIGDTDIDTYQETTEVYSGASSCRVDVNSGTQANCDLSNNIEISVTAGNSYTFTFWANTSDNVRITAAFDWVGASGSYSGIYVGPATGGWAQFTYSNTVPAGATGVKVRLRFYDVTGFTAPETQYVDDVVFESPTGTPLTVANGGFESWPSASSIASAYAISSTAVDVKYGASMTTVSASDYLLTGTSSITFSSATIDGSDDQLVHLTGASISMTGDNILDNINDAANATDFDFYAGIMPISYTNTTNSSGIIDNTHLATYKGIVSANDAFNNTWVSDAAGERNGVMIFDANFDALAAVGDEVLFTATRAVYLSQTELVTPMLLSTISTGNAPYGPSIINGSDISETITVDTDPGEKWEGQLITIENFTVDSYTDYDYRCSWSDGSNTFYFHVGDNVVYQLGGISMTVGNTYESITGVGDWFNSGPFYRINPRSQSDIEEVTSNTYIAGSFNGWSANDPAYLMTWNANGILVLTKTLQAGDNEYKVVDNGEWYPGNNNQHIILTQAEDITWNYSTNPNLVTHTLPVVAGDFFSTMGGNNWDPTELMGEMEDPDGDDIYTLELFIPTAGNYECKVTLNNNWDQSTGDNTAFSADGYNTTIFTYDFFNNILTVSVPPPPYITVVDPNGGEFLVKGQPYEISWDYGYWDGDIKIELLQDGFDPQLIKTNIAVSQYSIIWNVWVDQAVDTNYRIRISSLDPDEPTDDSDADFSIIDPYIIPNIVITEIMYNPPEAGNDSLEFVELYNNSMDTINLEGCYFSKGIEFIFPSVEILPDTFLLVAINSAAMNSTFGVQSLQWTSGALSNGGEELELKDQYDNIIDFVPYDDALPWDTMADGRGPSLTLCDPDADNALAYSWTASQVFAAINAAGDSIFATPGFECGIAFLADFIADNTIVQVGNGVNFTDQTIGNPISWMWTFEGGVPGTYEGQTPPEIIYDAPGTWDVTLEVSDGTNNDVVTFTDYIWSGYAPMAEFHADNTDILAGTFTNFFSDATGESLSFDWYFEGGTPDISSEENPQEIYYLIYDFATYDVTLVVTNPFGSDSMTKADYITTWPESVPDRLSADEIKLYPNPNNGLFTIDFPAGVEAEVIVMDITGRPVFEKRMSAGKIDLSGLQKGLYLVKLKDVASGNVFVKRLVIH